MVRKEGARAEEAASKQATVEEVAEEEEGPPPGWESQNHYERGDPMEEEQEQVSQPQTAPKPTAPIPSSEMAQMVCGSCQCLLSYPKGSRYVQCASCQTANFVLEAHELGVVKCGSCQVLLMYPHAASSVRCASCRFVTEIGEHNKRPPWSVQQGNSTPPPNPVC